MTGISAQISTAAHANSQVSAPPCPGPADRDPSQAHLTIVFAALAIIRFIDNRTG
jgi:hypothetical protein